MMELPKKYTDALESQGWGWEVFSDGKVCLDKTDSRGYVSGFWVSLDNFTNDVWKVYKDFEPLDDSDYEIAEALEDLAFKLKGADKLKEILKEEFSKALKNIYGEELYNEIWGSKDKVERRINNGLEK